MFSVDNFYYIFRSYYGWPENNENIMVIPTPHGTKNWESIIPYSDSRQFLDLPVAHQNIKGKILMHDQEPFFDSHADLYRNTLDRRKKIHVSKHASSAELLQFRLKSGKVPIICHSELGSKDIECLEKNLFISCYYWWHGMIARDWFRHWQWHSDLVNKDFDSYSYRFLFYCRATDGTRSYRSKILDELRKFSHCVKHDWNNTALIPPEYSATIDIKDALESAVHVVAETLFETEKIYLTEKVFKPMVMNQPFILYGPPGSLRYLHDYGFRTFPALIDESYDLIVDHNQRLDFINYQIKKLSEMPEVEFRRRIADCVDSVKHNNQRFYSSDFQNLLINEMHSNMQNALATQKNLEKDFPGGSHFWVLDRLLQKGIPRTELSLDLAFSQYKLLQELDPDTFVSVNKKYPQIFT